MTHRESHRAQAGSPRDAAPAGALILPALVLAAAILPGCAGVWDSGNPADAITIERIDSAHAEIASAQVQEAPGGIQVRGRLEKRFAGRSPIQGHLHGAMGSRGLSWLDQFPCVGILSSSASVPLLVPRLGTRAGARRPARWGTYGA